MEGFMLLLHDSTTGFEDISPEEIQAIIVFFYRKILTSDHNPVAVLDSDYRIWTLGAKV